MELAPAAAQEGYPKPCDPDIIRGLPADSHDCKVPDDGGTVLGDEAAALGDVEWRVFAPEGAAALQQQCPTCLPCEVPSVPGGALGTAPPPPGAGLLTATGLMTSRIFRDGVVSQCVPQKAYPVPPLGGSFNHNVYYFGNPSGQSRCVTVNFNTGACGTSVHASAWTGVFEPTGAFPAYKHPDQPVWYVHLYG